MEQRQEGSKRAFRKKAPIFWIDSECFEKEEYDQFPPSWVTLHDHIAECNSPNCYVENPT